MVYNMSLSIQVQPIGLYDLAWRILVGKPGEKSSANIPG